VICPFLSFQWWLAVVTGKLLSLILARKNPSVFNRSPHYQQCRWSGNAQCFQKGKSFFFSKIEFTVRIKIERIGNYGVDVEWNENCPIWVMYPLGDQWVLLALSKIFTHKFQKIISKSFIWNILNNWSNVYCLYGLEKIFHIFEFLMYIRNDTIGPIKYI
jgi:hypothetical protein